MKFKVGAEVQDVEDIPIGIIVKVFKTSVNVQYPHLDYRIKYLFNEELADGMITYPISDIRVISKLEKALK